LQVTGKTFFITCNLLPVRTQLTESDFEELTRAIGWVRIGRGFLFMGYVLMPGHWHALIIPHEGDVLPNPMDRRTLNLNFTLDRSDKLRYNSVGKRKRR